MFLSRVSTSLVPVLASLLLLGCGSRSTLRATQGDPPPDGVGACVTDADCTSQCALQACEAGECVDLTPIVCDDGDPCTQDSCDAATGCVFAQVTPDADGDGHHAALPGYLPGEAGACGDDCDDTSALALPGGSEQCDGTDNDCDGVIDNGHSYLHTRLGHQIVRVASPNATASGGAGIAFGEGVFAVSYGADQGTWQSYLHGFLSHGQEAFGETQLTDLNVLSFGAALEWSGNAFGAAWSDPRQDGNYEVYFARFDSSGTKLGPDLRVTDADDFSVHPDIVYDSGRFLLVWDDRRTSVDVDEALVFGQAIDSEGRLVGGNVQLSPSGIVSEFPEIGISDRRLGVVFSALEPLGGAYLGFRTFDKSFGAEGPFVELGEGNVQGPRIAGLRDRFVVTWATYDAFPGSAIMAAVLSDAGEVLVPPQPVTFGAQFARTHTTLSLGDRLVMVWADDFDGNYELYAQVLGSSLEVIEPRFRLTYDGVQSVGPVAALSEDGVLGVLFDQFGADGHHAYFTALGCPQVIIK
jgi:hypothetical protein